jgi:hypothetical protein
MHHYEISDLLQGLSGGSTARALMGWAIAAKIVIKKVHACNRSLLLREWLV